MKHATCFLLAVGMLAGGDGNGIRPRGNSTEYPSHETAGAVTIAAAAIPPEQVRKLFATDLSGYIVMEVAVYLEPGKQVDLSFGDFLLRIGSNSETIRAANAQAIASILQKKNAPQPPRATDVTIYPTATIGYESGGYDPTTGRRRSGVYTGAGVGVGVGGAGGPINAPRPASTDRDRTTMQQELEDKSLPEGKTTHTVAGYLYFPKPSGKSKSAVYDLSYYGAETRLRLLVPPPPAK
jgi:hypothetical protein